MSTIFLHQAPQSSHRFLPQRFLYLLPSAHPITYHLLHQLITQRVHSISHREPFSSLQPHSQTLYPHITYLQRKSYTLHQTTPPSSPKLLTRVSISSSIIAVSADVREARFATSPKMCLQTIGICNLDHSEHLGFHFCSLLISRGLWNPFECSRFEAVEIESYHSSCQTCLEQSVGWKIYNDRSVTLKLWRAVSRKISHHRKRQSKRHSGGAGWEMQNICAVESVRGVPSIRSSKYGYLGD